MSKYNLTTFAYFQFVFKLWNAICIYLVLNLAYSVQISSYGRYMTLDFQK